MLQIQSAFLKLTSSVDPHFVVLNDFCIPHVSVKVSAAATSRSRLGCRASRLGLGPLRLGSRLDQNAQRLGLGPLRLGSRLGLGLKGLVHSTANKSRCIY